MCEISLKSIPVGILWKTYRKITVKYWVNILKNISKITMEKIVTLPWVFT